MAASATSKFDARLRRRRERCKNPNAAGQAIWRPHGGGVASLDGSGACRYIGPREQAMPKGQAARIATGWVLVRLRPI